MKYLCVTMSASELIATDKNFQSIETEDGILLADYLTGVTNEPPVRPKIFFKITDDGIIIKCDESNIKNVLVIDIEEAKIFDGFYGQQVIVIFQKIIRFALKYWKNLKFSSYEWNIANSTKSVVFPFPVSSQSLFRLVFERAPDAKRSDRRQENHLLLYKSGTSEGGGATEVANIKNFRKAIIAINKESRPATSNVDQSIVELKTAFSITELSEVKSNNALLLPFGRCMHLMTKPQKDFILSDFRSIQRLEGPAGTGKSLCLRLRAIQILKNAKKDNREHHLLYVVPSVELCKETREAFILNDDDHFIDMKRDSSLQSIYIVTLQELCANLLNTEISSTEFLDIDSLESKNTQLYYLHEIITDFIKNDLETFKKSISPDFYAQFQEENAWHITELFQHEISHIIKGRARQDLEKYKSLERNWHGLFLNGEADINTSFRIFQRYQDRLEAASQFDIDDIVISTIQQLEAPIWKRRRKNSGYDSILIDEIHLFNMNELSIFHDLAKSDIDYYFSYAIDKTQAIGDTGWSQRSFDEALEVNKKESVANRISTVFRSSPQIIELAFSVTMSGSTLFTTFDNPLEKYIASYTFEEEQKCTQPVYWECDTDEIMIDKVFKRAEELNKDLQCGKGNVLIVSFDETLWHDMKNYCIKCNKPVANLIKRGDFGLIKTARQNSRFVLSLPDFVGGLEFSAVLLVGVDKGRVPQTSLVQQRESINFLNYSAHNKMYVAITRSKYVVELFGIKARGVSDLLKPALDKNLLERRELS